MSSSPLDKVLGALGGGGYDPRPVGPGGFESRCPGHKGSRRNLSVKQSYDGKVLLKCHHSDETGRCSVDSIVAELGLTIADLFPREPGKSTPKPRRAKATFEESDAAADWIASKIGGRITGRWMYLRDGTACMVVNRIETATSKEYRPIRFDPASRSWMIGDPAGPLPLYRLGDLVNADRIYFPEGEKCPTWFGNLA